MECFAKRASAFNHRLVDGEQVRLVRDAEARDRYGRLLAYVYRVRDKRFVNAALVRRGYARAADDPAQRRARRAVPEAGLRGPPRRARTVVILPGVIRSAGLSMKMRQSLADIEAQFVEEIESDRERRERLQQQAIRRTRVRHRERAHKRGSLRFWLVLLTLISTAVIVTIAMFETLYYVMG